MTITRELRPDEPALLSLGPEELRMLISAVESYVCDFGHDEADVLAECQQLLHKLRSAAEGPTG